MPAAIEIDATEVGARDTVATAAEGISKLTNGVSVKSFTELVKVMLAIEVGESTGSSCAPPEPEIVITGSDVKLPRLAESSVTPAIGAGVS